VRHHLRRLFLWFGCGAVSSIALAAGLCCTSSGLPAYVSRTDLADNFSYWSVWINQRIGIRTLSAQWCQGTFLLQNFATADLLKPPSEPVWPTWACELSPLGRPRGDTFHQVFASEAGWPLPCLGGGFEAIQQVSDDGPPGLERWYALAIDPISPSRITHHPRLLPWRPLWGGLAINSLVLSSPLLLYELGSLLRSALRPRKGQCVQCGYPTGQFTTCPECGLNCGLQRSA
jgi:hypothetical protein